MITIRPVAHNELPAIDQMQKAWALSFTGYQIWGDELLAKAVSDYFVVAVDDADDRILGYAIAAFYPQHEPHIMVHDLFVSDDHEGQGTGSQLPRARLVQAREDGHGLVRLKPTCEVADEPRLERFYKMHGFDWDASGEGIMRIRL